MVSNLLNQTSASTASNNYVRKEEYLKNHYFDNETVERLMYKYVEGACTDIKLRDEIMTHASEVIRQLIKAHNLSQIYPGKDESSMMDLFQTAWAQLESALYKYEAVPHCAACYDKLKPHLSVLTEEFIFADELVKKVKKCPYCKTKVEKDLIYYKGKSKIFNLFSQIARTVILAYIKKENRDRKNSPMFISHLEHKTINKGISAFNRFISEAKELNKYNDDYILILNKLEELYKDDDRAHEGLISKLVDRTGLPRATITGFFKVIRLRSHELSDSPLNDDSETLKKHLPNGSNNEQQDD